MGAETAFIFRCFVDLIGYEMETNEWFGFAGRRILFLLNAQFICISINTRTPDASILTQRRLGECCASA